jgi:hypothetical protein
VADAVAFLQALISDPAFRQTAPAYQAGVQNMLTTGNVAGIDGIISALRSWQSQIYKQPVQVLQQLDAGAFSTISPGMDPIPTRPGPTLIPIEGGISPLPVQPPSNQNLKRNLIIGAVVFTTMVGALLVWRRRR